jgi:FdhE protein
MKSSAWSARIARAEELAAHSAAAGELLRFYARVAALQQDIDRDVSSRAAADPGASLRSQLRIESLLPFFPPLLGLVEKHGPEQLAQAAHELAAGGESAWRELLLDHIAGEPVDACQEFFARASVQPYAEHLARGMMSGAVRGDRSCPLCSGKPQFGVLRPEGEGARRSLTCSFCLVEWEFRRIVCPACGEENDAQMTFYRAEEFPHIRVESCETCHCYLKSVDLATNGLAVPLVDELAAASLDLWAAERGLTKITSNLLGL